MKRMLAAKFAALFGAFALLVGLLICSITYVSYRSSMLEHYGNYASGVAIMVASILDPQELLHYAETLERDERYAVLEKELANIRESLGVKYVYVQMPMSDVECMYLFDIYSPEEEPSDTLLGAREYYGIENYKLAKLAMSTGKAVKTLDITNGEDGYLASAFVPISLGEGQAPFAYVGVDIAMDDILGFLRRYLSVIVFATTVVVILCFSVLFFLIRHSVINPIRIIAEKTGEFTQKMRDESFEELKIHSNDEIGNLSASVNKMFKEIRDFTWRLADETARRERVQSELDLGCSIQKGVLPRFFPPFHNCPQATIFACMNPAKEIGGDFYDFFVVNENELVVVIADVSGKGIPAALFMMVARTLIKNQALSGGAPHEILEAVNNQLCQNNEAGMFVTVFIGILDTNLNTLKYSNAGHNPPVVVHKGYVECLPVQPGFILGVTENTRFVTQEMELKEDDVLLLYTDGVTEAMNESKELFGDKRLIRLLSAMARGTVLPKALIETVNEEIELFVGEAEQADDITMLALCNTSA